MLDLEFNYHWYPFDVTDNYFLHSKAFISVLGRNNEVMLQTVTKPLLKKNTKTPRHSPKNVSPVNRKGGKQPAFNSIGKTIFPLTAPILPHNIITATTIVLIISLSTVLISRTFNVAHLNVVGKTSTAIESIMLLETFAAAWKIDDSAKTLAVPAEKYRLVLQLPAISANVTKNKIVFFFLENNYFLLEISYPTATFFLHD